MSEGSKQGEPVELVQVSQIDWSQQGSLKALIASLLHVVHRSLIGMSLTANELENQLLSTDYDGHQTYLAKVNAA